MRSNPTEHFAGLRDDAPPLWDVTQLCLYGFPPTLYPAEQAPDEEAALVPLFEGGANDDDGSTHPIIMVDRYDCRLLMDPSEFINDNPLPSSPLSSSSLEAFLDKERYRDLHGATDSENSEEDRSLHKEPTPGIPYSYPPQLELQLPTVNAIPPPFLHHIFQCDEKCVESPSIYDWASLSAQLTLMHRVAKYVAAVGEEEGSSKVLEHARRQDDPTFSFLDPENGTHYAIFKSMVAKLRNDSNAKSIQELVGQYGDGSESDDNDSTGETESWQTQNRELLMNAIFDRIANSGLIRDKESFTAVYTALKSQSCCDVLTPKDLKAVLTRLVGEAMYQEWTETRVDSRIDTHHDVDQSNPDSLLTDEIPPWIKDRMPNTVDTVERKKAERLAKAKVLLERRRLERECALKEQEHKRQLALQSEEKEKQRHVTAISVHKQMFLSDEEDDDH